MKTVFLVFTTCSCGSFRMTEDMHLNKNKAENFNFGYFFIQIAVIQEQTKNAAGQSLQQ